VRPRLVPISLVALAISIAALIVAGCGGGGDSSSGTDPAEAAPAATSVFVEATIKPEGETSENIDSLAQKVFGIENVGDLIVEELEASASDSGNEIDVEKEIEPWLGSEAAIFMYDYDGDDFNSIGASIQVEDEAEAEEFVTRQFEQNAEEEEAEEGSYKGVDFRKQEDGTTAGFTDGLLVLGEEESIFKEAIDALDGENLAAEDKYTEAADEVPDGAAADVFVDIGGLIEEAGQGIDSETEEGLKILGIEPKGATGMISMIPGSDNLEIDISSNVSTTGATAGGDASELIGSLPAGSIGAIGTADFGNYIAQAIETVDKEGIPGQIPPGEFKKAIGSSGVDLDEITSSIGDLAIFVEGNSQANLGGAMVLEATDQSQAQNTIKNLGLFLRATGQPGVTAISEDGVNGFSLQSDEIGPQAIVVAAKGEKIAFAYGLKAAVAALSGKGGTLSEDPSFKAAEEALGDTPISGYVSGQSALTLFDALASPLELEEFEEARPFLEKVSYLAIGGSSEGDTQNAKLIFGVSE
jgi:hypothetical protein